MKYLVLLFYFYTALFAQSSSEKLILGGVEVLRGTKVTINIELPKLYNTPTQLPIRVIRGKEDGPIVFVSAAIHGDELNGIEIIRRLRKLEILDELRGTLVLIPIVNIYGVMTLSRYLPDRRDLNRYFPGSSEGSLASRIADIFMNEIVLKCDLGIDLHTASIHKANLPQVRTNIDNEHTLRLAQSFGSPLVMHSETIDGSLRQVSQQQGVPILLYEAGEALRFDEESIRIGVNGIINVLIAEGMLPRVNHQEHIKPPFILRESKWLRAMKSGVIVTTKGLGDTIKKGDVIAHINEPLIDDASFDVLAPYDGIIIGKSKLPLIQEGDAIFHIANFVHQISTSVMKPYYCGEAIEECEYMNFNNEEIIEE